MDLLIFHSDVLVRPGFGVPSLKPETTWDLSSNSLKSYGREALAANRRLETNSFKACVARERLLPFLPSAPPGFFHAIFMHIPPQYQGFSPPCVRAKGSMSALPETQRSRSAPVTLSDPNVARKLWQGLLSGVEGHCCAVFCSALKWPGFSWCTLNWSWLKGVLKEINQKFRIASSQLVLNGWFFFYFFFYPRKYGVYFQWQDWKCNVILICCAFFSEGWEEITRPISILTSKCQVSGTSCFQGRYKASSSCKNKSIKYHHPQNFKKNGQVLSAFWMIGIH